MKRVLFVLSRIPWPSDTGKKGLISYWCNLISSSLKMEVYLFFVNCEEFDKRLMPSFISGYENGSKNSTFVKLKNIVFHSFFGTWPLQSSLYYSKKNASLLKSYCDKIRPDFIIFDMVRLMNYSKFVNNGAVKIMDLEDLLSSRYKKELKSKTQTNIFGESGEKSFIQKIASIKAFRKLALKLEISKVKKAEKKCSALFDKITFIAKAETDYFNSITRSTKALQVPIGIDADFYSKTNNAQDEGYLSFLGNYHYSPNYASACYICETILPLLSKKYKMVFVGPAPEELVRKYASDNVSFLGRVDDVREHIGKSSIMLAPISYGTGIKTKIIESMAMGKCVVTNSVGFENIDAVAGEHLFVADSPGDIAMLVDSLMADKRKRDLVGKKAQELALTKYNYGNVIGALKDLLS